MTKTEMIGFSMKYEKFICRAFKCERDKHGASADFFRIFAETEPNYKGTIPPSFEKQYSNLIKSLNKAIDKFVKSFEFSEDEKIQLENMKSRLEKTKSAEKIGEILTDGVEITQRYY